MSDQAGSPRTRWARQGYRPTVLGVLGFLLLTVPRPSAGGEVIPFVFGLAGEQEVPPVETAATGGCYAVLDVAQVNITCAHNVVAASAAHIHLGAPGVAGPIVFDLGDPSSSPFFASWTDPTPRDIQDLLAGDLYVNIHSATHPGGEVRGQIVERTIDDFVFFPDAEQEVPPTGSEATGVCAGDLADDVITLALSCTHDVFMPTGAHIHRGAKGVNGPILFDLGDPTSPIMSVANLLPPDLAELAAGLLYVNIHSAAFPGGEIRGQMVIQQVFADGFESGDTSAWSQTVP